eukprot:SAG11_NODE_146_length_14788_cov_5.672884_6_plen_579_part_00
MVETPNDARVEKAEHPTADEAIVAGTKLVALSKSKIRSGLEMTSAVAGEVKPGEVLMVLEVGRTNVTGQLRVRHTRGWSSVVTSGSGRQLLRKQTEGELAAQAVLGCKRKAGDQPQDARSPESSKRHKLASCAPSGSTAPTADEAIVAGTKLVALSKSKIRSGLEMTSAVAGEVKPGEVLMVLEVGRTIGTGQLRVRHTRGWSSVVTSGSGRQLLRKQTELGSPARETRRVEAGRGNLKHLEFPWPSRRQPKPKPEASEPRAAAASSSGVELQVREGQGQTDFYFEVEEVVNSQSVQEATTDASAPPGIFHHHASVSNCQGQGQGEPFGPQHAQTGPDTAHSKPTDSADPILPGCGYSYQPDTAGPRFVDLRRLDTMLVKRDAAKRARRSKAVARIERELQLMGARPDERQKAVVFVAPAKDGRCATCGHAGGQCHCNEQLRPRVAAVALLKASEFKALYVATSGALLDRSARLHVAQAYEQCRRQLEAQRLGPVAGLNAAAPIAAENKGFRMLQSMGWRRGEGIGAAERCGAVEPIQLAGRAHGDRLGLGGSAPKKGKRLLGTGRLASRGGRKRRYR